MTASGMLIEMPNPATMTLAYASYPRRAAALHQADFCHVEMLAANPTANALFLPYDHSKSTLRKGETESEGKGDSN